MKIRTIEDLHDKEVGHKKFAKVCDLLIESGHTLSNIKEFYEKFTFDLDNYYFEYSKEWKASAKEMADYLIKLVEMKKELRKRELL